MDAILYFYNENRLLPRGITITAPSIQDWACKVGGAVRKLVSCSISNIVFLVWLGYLVAIHKLLLIKFWLALQVSKFRHLAQRARSSHQAQLRQLKDELQEFLNGAVFRHGMLKTC